MSNQSIITQSGNERNNDLKVFDERKTGVKGLVDEGAAKLPSIFIRSVEERSKDHSVCLDKLSVPVIDLDHSNITNTRKEEIVNEIHSASEGWGFFQVVNHGVPLEVLDDMIQAIKMFHEQDREVKKQFYTRELSKRVRFACNHDLFQSTTANWRDTLNISTVLSGKLDPEELPPICRDAILAYVHHVTKLCNQLLELLSMALGLESDHLRKMECTKAWNLVGHYYPSCPEPDLTLGASEHSDTSFLTILLQDHIGGLQVLQNNQWVNVEPLPGALIVNIGDILQIISNDKLRSAYHRVVANKVGPRVSIAFFFTGLFSSEKIYGPIKELISEENQPRYKDFTLGELFMHFLSRPLDQPGIELLKI